MTSYFSSVMPARRAAAAVGSILLGVALVACSGPSIDLEQLIEEAVSDAESAQGADDADDAADDATGDTGADGNADYDSSDDAVDSDADNGESDAEPIVIPAQNIDATVGHNELEYTIGEMTVVDLDEQDGNLDRRRHGIEVMFDVLVHNPGNDARAPNLRHSLAWTDVATGLTNEVQGNRLGDATIGGGGSANIEFVHQIYPAELADFTLDTAVLLLGQDGSHAAVVPLGSEGELETTFPHPQPDIAGKVIDFDGLATWTIDEAMVTYRYGNSNLPDSEALLVIDYTFANHTDSQLCHWRGAGKNFSVVSDATSLGGVDLGTERCVAAGDEETWRTGIKLPYDEDFFDSYTMTGYQEVIEEGTTNRNEMEATIEFNLMNNATAWSELS